MFNHHDITRNGFMLHGPLGHRGYDWWWHSFTAQDVQTGEDKAFFIEFFICNPALAEDEPVLGQLPANRAAGKRPSYLMVKAGCWGEDHMQLHRFFSLKDVRLHPEAPFEVEAGDCFASETALRGSVHVTQAECLAHPEWMCDAGSMSWELTVDKQIAFNVGYGAGKPFREAEAFAMYWPRGRNENGLQRDGHVRRKRILRVPGQVLRIRGQELGQGFYQPVGMALIQLPEKQAYRENA